MGNSKLKIIAAAIAVLYIGVQIFQWFVFTKIPITGNNVTDFINGSNSWSIYRSSFMLMSMFGLLFIYFVICLDGFLYNKALSLLAFLGFFIFTFFEIMIRSVELFYIQIYLPSEYLSTADKPGKSSIISIYEGFQQVEFALYFPLGIAQLLGSILLFYVFPSSPRVHYLIKITLLLNALRLALRMLTTYLKINILPDPVYDAIYLPMVFVFFSLTAAWLFKTAKVKT